MISRYANFLVTVAKCVYITICSLCRSIYLVQSILGSTTRFLFNLLCGGGHTSNHFVDI